MEWLEQRKIWVSVWIWSYWLQLTNVSACNMVGKSQQFSVSCTIEVPVTLLTLTPYPQRQEFVLLPLTTTTSIWYLSQWGAFGKVGMNSVWTYMKYFDADKNSDFFYCLFKYTNDPHTVCLVHSVHSLAQSIYKHFQIMCCCYITTQLSKSYFSDASLTGRMY